MSLIRVEDSGDTKQIYVDFELVVNGENAPFEQVERFTQVSSKNNINAEIIFTLRAMIDGMMRDLESCLEKKSVSIAIPSNDGSLALKLKLIELPENYTIEIK